MKAHHASLSPPKPERKVHIIKTHSFLSKSYLVIWCKRLDYPSMDNCLKRCYEKKHDVISMILFLAMLQYHNSAVIHSSYTP